MTMPATTDSPISVAIVGGGIVGLCLALGILKHAPHVNVDIYEAAPAFAEIGAGVAFGINAQRALHLLDPRAGQGYTSLHTSNAEQNVLNGAGGEAQRKETYLRVIMGMDHKTNPGILTGREITEIFCEGGFSSVHRARFLDAMVALVPEHVRSGHVHFHKRLTSITSIAEDSGSAQDRVHLTFADGSTATATALIGCDGIKSQVRQILLNGDSHNAMSATPVFTGKYAYRGLIPMPLATSTLGPRLSLNAHHHVGYDGHVLTFPIDHGDTLNVVAFRTKTPDRHHWYKDKDWTSHVTKQAMLDDFDDWGDDVRKIINMMEKCDQWALFDHFHPAETYHSDDGRICLVGDAAHASTPHQGSGAGMGVEDAFVLSSLLADCRESEDLSAAFAAFEATRKERTQKLVRRSREQSELYDFQCEGVGDDVQQLAEILPQRWDWIWDWKIEDEVKRAKDVMRDGKAEQAVK